jgi:transcriptional regulator with XRE-family HTH domain
MREAQGLTMEAFARKMRVAMNTVSRWENSLPPSGKSLEKVHAYAQIHGPATSADTLLRAITREKTDEYRRYRTAQILDPGNLHDVQLVLRRLYRAVRADINPFFEAAMLEDLLLLADFLLPGKRAELEEEDEK